MEEGNKAGTQFLHQQHQQQLFLSHQREMQHQQRHHSFNPIRCQQHPPPSEAGSPEKASAMLISSSSANEGAHLHFPMGLRALYLNNLVTEPQPQLKPAVPHPSLSTSVRAGSFTESEMARMDAASICNPDFRRPFSSIEDAVNRLLPYHVVADNEAEEEDEIFNRSSIGEIICEPDNQWDANIERKLAEFAAAFDNQVLAFNILSQKRNLGEFRSEERLMIEYALLQEERQAVLQLKEEMEAIEKAKLHALTSNTQMLLAQAEQARVAMHGYRQASGNNSDVMSQKLENAALWKHKEPSEGYPSCEQEFYDVIGWPGPGGLDLNLR